MSAKDREMAERMLIVEIGRVCRSEPMLAYRLGVMLKEISDTLTRMDVQQTAERELCAGNVARMEEELAGTHRRR